jgi:hypothetical protein
MIPQHFPIYATMWHPGRAGEGDSVDDSPYVVIGWQQEGSDLLPIVLKLGGHNGPPFAVVPVPNGKEGPTLDYADSLADALATIENYPADRRV